MKTHYVCWSGGVDSTFVVTQLSQFPVEIQPLYIKGQSYRQSEPQEIAGITAIRELLIADPRTKAKILPIMFFEKDDPRVKDHEVVKAFRRVYMRLLKKYKEKNGGVLPPAGSTQIYVDGAFLPPQDIAFASLAKYFGETIEIGATCNDLNEPWYRQCSMTKFKDEDTGRDLMRMSEDSDKDMFQIFQSICFPIAGQGLYKTDLWQWYADNDYLQVRSNTIFCQAPVIHEDGTYEPCGRCSTCIAAIHSELLEPFTEAGLARYRDYELNHEKEPERFRLKGF